MKLADFQIGKEFTCRNKRWKCTDIGSRVIIAICLGGIKVDSIDAFPSALKYEEALSDGWFNGPPYAVAEVVFDEHDLEGIEE